MAKVTFRFEEGEPVVTYATEGERLLEVAQKSNVPIDAPCSGNASCGKCRVRLVSGELDSKITRHISEEEYQNGWRLACVSTIRGDVEVEVPDIASAYRSRMKVADLSSPSEIAIFEDTKKKITDAGLELKNSMQVITISMEEPTLDDTMPDNERVTWAVQAATGLERVRIPYSVLKKMPDVLRESHFQAQCVVRVTANDVFLYDMLPMEAKAVVGGLVVDIGTTTVSALIVDMLSGEILAKASSGNGQIRYGADVINRIIESQKPGGHERLQNAIIKETLNPMISNMCRAAKISSHQIYRAAIAGNTTMEHLMMGINADPLRMEPYIPAFFKTNDSRQFLILTARKGSIRKSSQPVPLISIYVYLKIATFRGRRDFCHMPATRGVYAESGGSGFSVPVFPPVFFRNRPENENPPERNFPGDF